MTPRAVLDDALLDFVFARSLSRWQLLRLLPKTFKGTHVDHPRVSYGQTKILTITSSPDTPIQADGEAIAKEAKEINCCLAPMKLRVIV